MNRFSAMIAVLAIGMCLPAGAGPPRPKDGTGRAQQRSRADKVRGPVVRASQIAGMDVHNREGKTLGTVYDIVIDAHTGRVRYAALSYGGFMGFGDTLVAVPWGAFTLQDIKGRNEYNLVLHATEDQIKSAHGFDENDWPDLANRKLAKELDAHYGIERRKARRDGGIAVEVGPQGVDVDVD